MPDESAETVQVGMLIRRPVPEVFDAFVDPAQTTRFWFTKSSGRLEPGKEVLWEWEMFGAAANVTAQVVDPNERIEFEWGAPDSRTTVQLRFSPRGSEATYLDVTVRGFQGDAAAITRQMVDASAGFATVLAGAKAWLEHRLELNLIADRYPDGH